ncbi:hypothetical protein [Nostoc sp. 106C]|uniref:hypothetical protein n=1 Tax=Nostoc sp. 106C TaxID=1932667 RepID=UPI000A397423|nr:hypothetical protein [Nostoc sp. 106C]OUL34336.1 hypothetical protein BV375_04810 [Nostoc sp. 106C]
MNKQRNYINEILAKKGRVPPETNRWELVSGRLNEISSIRYVVDFLEDIERWSFSGLEECEGYDEWIKQSYEKVQYSSGMRKELLRYIPIDCVACIEGYFRQVYANLIDYGSNYKKNAGKLKDIKLSIEEVINLDLKSVSIGEFIAHLLPTKNLETINENISILTNKNFLEELYLTRTKIKPTHIIKYDEVNQVGVVNIDDKLHQEMKKSVNKIFELRHKFCHEIDPIFSEDEDSIVEYSQGVIEFLWLSEKFFQELLSL